MSQMVIGGEGKDVRKTEADISRFFKVIHKGENNAPIVDCAIVSEMKLQNVESSNNTSPNSAEQPNQNINSLDQPLDGSLPKKRLFPLITKAARKDNSVEQIDKPVPLIFATAGAKKIGGGRATRCPNTTPKSRKNSTSSPRKPKAARAGGKRKVEDVVLVSYSDFLQNNASSAAASERSVPKEDVYQYDSDEEDADLGIVRIDYRKTADKQKCITKYFSTAAATELSNGAAKPSSQKNARGRKAETAISRGRGRPRGSTSKANKCNGGPLSSEDSAAVVTEYETTKSLRPKSAKRAAANRTREGEDDNAGISVRRSPRVRSHPDLFDASTLVTHSGGTNISNSGSRRCPSRSKEDQSAVDGKPGTVYQVSVINEKGGKQCIRLRLTRVGQQSEKAKFVVGTAQRLLNKAKLNKELASTKKPVKRFTKIQSQKKKTPNQDPPKQPLAQIFLNSKTKNEVIPAVIPVDELSQQRRQDFLTSGIPEKLRRQISMTDEMMSSYTEFLFPSVSHVQQRDTVQLDAHSLPPTTFREVTDDGRLAIANGDLLYGTLTNCADVEESHDVTSAHNVSRPEELVKLSLQDALVKIATSCELEVNVQEMLDSYKLRKNKSTALDKLSGKSNGNSLEESSDSECVVLSAVMETAKQQPCQAERSGLKRGRKGKQGKANKRLKPDEEDDCVVLDPVVTKSTPLREDELAVTIAQLPDLMWTSVYRPRCAGDVLGNRASMEELGAWLMQWRAINASKPKSDSRKRSKRKGDDESESSDDSENGGGALCNTVLLAGTSGCGKTSAIYALAEELGYTVLEVNASSRRSGKQILNRLREATLSRHIKESPAISNSHNAIASMFANASDRKNSKCQPEPDVPGLQRSGTLSSTSAFRSLILFEDVDLLFSDDDGFWAAVNNFMASAKTPIVLTTCDSKFGEKGCIRGNFKEIIFEHPSPRLQTLHLQLICLSENHYIRKKELATLVGRHRGNFRQAINNLQYMLRKRAPQAASDLLAVAAGHNAIENLVRSTVSLLTEVAFTPVANAFLRKISKDTRLNLFSLFEAFDPDLVYTSMMSLFSGYVTRTAAADDRVASESSIDSSFTPTVTRTFRRSGPFLDARSIVLATAADVFDNSSSLDASLQPRKQMLPWCNLHPGLDDVLPVDEFGDHWSRTLQSEISSWLQQASYGQALATLGDSGPGGPVPLKLSPDLEFDSLLNHSATISETRTAVTRSLPTGVLLNREAIGLDYLPSLRDICRSERVKQSGGSLKRGGRYSHYLCSSVLYLEPATVTKLCDDLLDKL